MLKKLFETLRERCGVTKREFTEYFNSSVSFLRARYGDEYITYDGTDAFPISDEASPCPVCEEYIDGICDNIAYLKTGNENYRVDFIAKSEYAYRTVWRMRIKNKRVKGESW
ncbi:MAG: hypothetical protein E7619_01675 [Ruminococcaceae bacterium]|nr:hypothetical protein [Oscillospiraceae bacterium]